MGSNPISNMVSGACCEMLNTVISYHNHDTGQSGIIERMIYICVSVTHVSLYIIFEGMCLKIFDVMECSRTKTDVNIMRPPSSSFGLAHWDYVILNFHIKMWGSTAECYGYAGTRD